LIHCALPGIASSCDELTLLGVHFPGGMLVA
jgi:hypothetical protein